MQKGRGRGRGWEWWYYLLEHRLTLLPGAYETHNPGLPATKVTRQEVRSSEQYIGYVADVLQLAAERGWPEIGFLRHSHQSSCHLIE
jgi:hypothetical protein